MSPWLSQNYPIVIIAGLIAIIVIYAVIQQYRRRRTVPPQRSEQPRQSQPTAKEAAPLKPKPVATPAPQPAPAKTGFGVGIFNGVPVSISKEAGNTNGWAVHPMKYKDYAQSSDEVGKLAVLLASKLRDYENLRSLMAASKEAHDILVKADVEELDPIIKKLQSAMDRVELVANKKGENT